MYYLDYSADPSHGNLFIVLYLARRSEGRSAFHTHYACCPSLPRFVQYTYTQRLRLDTLLFVIVSVIR